MTAENDFLKRCNPNLKPRKILPNETFTGKLTWPENALSSEKVEIVKIGLEGDPETLDEIEKEITKLDLEDEQGFYEYEIETSETKPDWALHDCGIFPLGDGLMRIWTDTLCSSCHHPPCPLFTSSCDRGECLASESTNEQDCRGECRLPNKPRFWAEKE